MKKNRIIKIFLLLGVMIFCTFVSGCTTADRIDEGIHISENGTLTDDFDKEKYIIKEISITEYNQANGVNVFIDASSNKTPRYLSIELYLLPKNTTNYVLVTITNLKYREGTGDMYIGDAYLKLEDKIYESKIEYTANVYSVRVFEFDCVCVPNKYEIKEGVYHSLETSFVNGNYGESKLIIKEITKEEYETYDENVFIGQYNNQYIYIELSIYLKDVGQYKQINIKNISHKRRTDYKGECILNLGNILIESSITIQTYEKLIINIDELKLTYKY